MDDPTDHDSSPGSQVDAIEAFSAVTQELRRNDLVLNRLRYFHAHHSKESGPAEDPAIVAEERTREDLRQRLERIPVHLRPSQASARKAEQVFALPELLELVLLNLYPTDLLFAQRMNKAAEGVLRTSRSCRER